MTEKKILILGAGPAGLACAMELSKAEKNVIIIEKEDKVGGLAQTLEFREGNLLFRTDIGPHRFFSKNPYLYSLIKDLLGEKWILVPRKTRQFIDGKFYDYPINVVQALKNMGFLNSIKIMKSYISAMITYKIFKKRIISFEDYIVANFGKVLGELNMLNYTEKIWGVSCKKIHPDWAKQRIKGLNLISALKNALLKKHDKNEPKTLASHFYYPRYGTGLIYDTIAEKITKKGSSIFTNSYPTVIKHKNNKITEMEINLRGKKCIIKPDILVESVPITEFLKLLSPNPPQEVINAMNNLRWRNQVYLFITLDKTRITNDNWMYFPDKEIPFGRVAEMKNFSKSMSPEDKTSLFVEFFVFENDPIWDMPKEGLFRLAMENFENLNLFTRQEVRNYYLLKKKNVYPLYDMDYQKNLKIIQDYLNKFENLFYIGRPGRFKYNNQDHSLEMGIVAARSIIEGKKYDLESCGSESDYFEKGEIGVKEDSIEKRSYNWMILEDRRSS